MASIVFGFSSAKSVLKVGSRIIREVEKRKFSHAYIKYVDPITNITMISQASHGYVNITNYEIFIRDNNIICEYQYECNEEQFTNVLKFIFKNTGKPYSKLQLMLIAIKKLFHFEINVHNRDEAFICSEWVGKIAKIIGIDVPDELDYSTPSDIEIIVRN